MKNLVYRATQLLQGWGFVGVIYHLTDRLQGTGRVITPSLIDELIPFSANAIWPYFSFFLIIPLGYFMAPINAVRWLARAMQIAALGAGAMYLLWPTTLNAPVDTGHSLASILLKGLMAADSTQNCLPSLHVTLTLLAVWAVAKSRRDFMTWVLILWGLVIAFSILQLKRHLFIDLMGGVILAWIAGALAQRLTHTKELSGE